MERANKFLEIYRDIIASTPYLDSIYEQYNSKEFKIKNDGGGFYSLIDRDGIRFTSTNLKQVKAEHIVLTVLSMNLINDIIAKYRLPEIYK